MYSLAEFLQPKYPYTAPIGLSLTLKLIFHLLLHELYSNRIFAFITHQIARLLFYVYLMARANVYFFGKWILSVLCIYVATHGYMTLCPNINYKTRRVATYIHTYIAFNLYNKGDGDHDFINHIYICMVKAKQS